MPIKISDLPQWYDRNPKSKADSYDVALAPHNITQRLSYVCPSDKKAMVELLAVRVRRITVATDVELSGCYFNLKPAESDSWEELVFADIFDKNVNAHDEDTIGTTLMLFAEDILAGHSFDFSADGACTHFLAYKLTEFDAIPPIDKFIISEDAKPDIQQPSIIDDPPM